ncbi:MAG: aromatic ring-hydroxylating oxygenase subunit alpha, partial [Candidatus Limnocylindrus sp.]
MLKASRPAPLDPAAIAAVRRPFDEADMFPPRVYHDQEIFDWESQEIFRHEWRCVGREEETPNVGSYRLLEFAGEQVIISRGEDNKLHAFINACRHRGATLIEGPQDGKPDCGEAKKIVCPYHAWVYGPDGKLLKAKHTDDLKRFDPREYDLVPLRCETWQGFVFLTLDKAAEPLLTYLDDLVEVFARFEFAPLRLAKREVYDVAANWKILVENYSECYHCPGVHPQLNALTPYDLGEDIPARG